MNRHVIVGAMGAGDAPAVTLGESEVRSDLPLLNLIGLANGVQSALADLRKLNVAPTEVGIDLLVLASMVYAADTRISRALQAQDGWTREIRLVVPVSDVPLWDGARPVLIRALRFLTGDLWEFDFRPRPSAHTKLAPLRPAPLLLPDFGGVSLFSGGLDSLIGAIDSLARDEKPLLVSHAGEGAGSSAQHALDAALRKKFADRRFAWVRLPLKNLSRDADVGDGIEDSTRARSFLFFALGVATGTGLGRAFELNVPENGLIALNVPLDPLRLGALSTRTTHPFYMARWNELLRMLGIEGTLLNPYAAKTKGEMVEDCEDNPFLLSIAGSSISCSSPAKLRFQGFAQAHCGYCLPCLIRRAAMPIGDPTHYHVHDLREQPLKTTAAEGVQVRAFQLAIARLKARPELARILIHKPGPLFDYGVAEQEQMATVYARGLAEVGKLLDGVRTRPG